MINSLNGKIALITGGGSGLGAALSHTLAEAGAVTIVADIRPDNAQKVARQVEELGGEALAFPIDITDEGQIATLVQKSCDRYGKIDILLNNAGTDVTLPVEELSIADWDRVLSVNLRAPFILSQHILPLMKQQGSGHIVNITSTAAKRAWANASAYHASKWGLLGFSHALHVEARPHGVKVTAVVAGGMKTPFLLDRFPEIDITTLQDPKNVAQTICYLLMQPAETVIPEIAILPLKETSWP